MLHCMACDIHSMRQVPHRNAPLLPPNAFPTKSLVLVYLPRPGTSKMLSSLRNQYCIRDKKKSRTMGYVIQRKNFKQRKTADSGTQTKVVSEATKLQRNFGDQAR